MSGDRSQEDVDDQWVKIYTDGACSGNPGPGGWGAVLQYRQHSRDMYGYVSHTTNNRMEMMAVIRALETLKRPCKVLLTTDSIYVKNGITQWIHGWKRKNWRKSGGGSVKNADLWKWLDQEQQRHQMRWAWVKGHAGHAENEQADELARDAIDQGRDGTMVEDDEQPHPRQTANTSA